MATLVIPAECGSGFAHRALPEYGAPKDVGVTEATGSCQDSAGKRRNPVDLWDTDHGASTQNGTTASHPKGSVEAYEEYKLREA